MVHQQVLAAYTRRLPLDDVQTRGLDTFDDRIDALRAFRMSPAVVVAGAGRVCDEDGSHPPMMPSLSGAATVVSLASPTTKKVMALPDIPIHVTQRGTWPGRMIFQRGWASASARPWNDIEPAASLRLVRGGRSFLTACSEQILECGVPSVLSPPLPVASVRTWESAGYDVFLRLALMRLTLDDQPHAPDHLVVECDAERMDDLLEIDAAAFSSFWRFDRLGLTEALDATGRSSVLIIRDSDGKPTGFAVVGYGSAISYLQRVAIHPDWQGNGMGRSLVRVAARKARSAGARVMLLNTQLDNQAAMRLYESEGYVRLPEPLCLLRYTDDR